MIIHRGMGKDLLLLADQKQLCLATPYLRMYAL